MNKHIFAALSLAVFGIFMSGCVSTQSFVDPQYHHANFDSIHRLAQPISAKVESHFERNGKALPKVDNELSDDVDNTLRGTGVFIPSDKATTPVITVTANNIADMGAARAAGFKTGLTFGADGSTVEDKYVFTCTYHDASHDRTLTYDHAIYTTVGHTTPPAGMKPTTLTDAFGRVAQDVMLNFTKDLQEAGVVPSK